MKKHLRHTIFKTVSQAASELELPVYVVGGYVRDIILGCPSKDIDFVAIGSGIELARKVAEKLGQDTKINIYKNFGTALIHYQDMDFEFVGARKESYNFDSRKPVVENGTLEDDQNRRDFTINALAISLNKKDYGQLIDPFTGLRDIEKKVIRTPLEPGITFSDDPLRMMRAIRFATQLDFTIDEQCFNAIIENKERIKIVSAERIIDEINKIISSVTPSKGLQMMQVSGLLQLIIPELENLKGVENVEGKGHKDVFYHTLEVLNKVADVSENIWLRWAALLHDIAKPVVKKFDTVAGWTFYGHEFEGYKMVPMLFRRLKLPLGNHMRYVQKLVKLHLRPIVLSESEVTDSAIRRLIFEAGNDIDDLMLLCEADITTKNQGKARRYLKNFKIVRQKLIEIEEKDRIRNWQPPITGDVIMKTFKIKSGKEVGIIKSTIREAILDGDIPNTFEDAYKLMIETGKKLGLKPN